jgi:hypothetical protein
MHRPDGERDLEVHLSNDPDQQQHKGKSMKTLRTLSIAVGSALALIAGTAAWASTITSGFTYTVADAYTGAPGVGTHFHSNTGGAFGNPAGLAEVGRLDRPKKCAACPNTA